MDESQASHAQNEGRKVILKPLNQVSKEDIESLVSAKVSESRTLDYKQQLPDSDTEKKREFLYDVSSFANAAGGDMVFGITDERDGSGKSTGLPASVEGMSIPNASDTIARLENLVRDGIAPRISGIQWKTVEGFPSGSVLAMRIPRSTIGPHMVVFGGMARFYSRNSTGKYPMDIREIRSAFVESTEIGEKLHALRERRISEIMQGGTHLGICDKAVLALHLVPLSSVGFDVSHDAIRSAAKTQTLLQPITGGGWSGRYNFDGYLVLSSTSKSYVQVFRSGLIEAADASLLNVRVPGYEKMPPSIAFEMEVIRATVRYLDVQNRMTIPLPTFAAISLLRVKNFQMSSYQHVSSPAIDRDTVMLPEVLIEEYGADIGRVLRPSFDALWQACGLEKSLNYDDQGNWRQHHG
jgi:hypothetical protein